MAHLWVVHGCPWLSQCFPMTSMVIFPWARPSHRHSACRHWSTSRSLARNSEPGRGLCDEWIRGILWVLSMDEFLREQHGKNTMKIYEDLQETLALKGHIYKKHQWNINETNRCWGKVTRNILVGVSCRFPLNQSNDCKLWSTLEC